MRKIMKLLGKHWAAIIAVFAFLVAQAYCELTLPQYTSGIINVGIQQGGIENAVITEIRETELMKLAMFMAPSDAETALSRYTLGEDGIYRLHENLTADEKENLAEILGKPMLIAYAMNNMGDGSDIQLDMSGLAGADGFDMEKVNDAIDQLDPSIVSQVAVMYVKGEYAAIGVDTASMQTDYMIRSGLMMLLFAVCAMAANIVVTYLSARIGAAYGRDMRKSVFGKVMTFSSAEFDSISTASLITRCTNDVQQVTMTTVMMLRMVLYAPILGAGALIKVLNQGSSMTWVIAVGVAAVLLLVGTLFAVALPKFKIVQKLIDNLNRVSREILTGLPVIRAFSREEHEKKRFDAANVDITKLNLFLNRMMSVMFPAMMLIMNGLSVLIVWVGAGAVDSGSMQVGDLTAFITYAMQIIMAFLMLAMMSIMLPRAIVSQKRIGEILDTENSVKEPENPVHADSSKRGLVEFKDVSFHYGDADEEVLSGISFVSEPGKTTAIIGSTGSGKSTVVNLIPRFFDATGGEVLVSGVNVCDMTLNELRAQIGYVSQRAVLFSGTIASNIAYSDENMSEEQIRKAAEVAQSLDFIEEKEDKFADPISQGGTNVSGGQKQRLSIARAIAKNPDIYIFDDSFSALDYKTDVNLRKALNDYTCDSTVIIVAQRISTVLNADQIIVLDEGKIVGRGTHSELMTGCDVYRQIALSQLSQSELDGKENA